MMDILCKYEPKCLNEFIGNKIQIRKILDLMKNAEVRMIGIQGPNGCGKSLLCKLLLKEYHLHEIYDANNIEKNILSFCTFKSIDSFFSKKEKMIYLDNLDSLMLQDKNVISTILSCIPSLKKNNIRMVFTCNFTGHVSDERKMDFKKEAEIVKINFPSVKDSFVYLCDIFLEKEMRSDISDEVILRYVNQYRGSIRDVVLNIFDSNESNDDFKRSHQFNDLNHFDIVKKIMLMPQKYSFQDLEYIMQDDPNIIGFMLYENIPDEMNGNFETPNLIDTLLNINDRFVDSCAIEENIFRHSEWGMYNNVHIMRIIYILAELKVLNKKKTYKDLKYRFSQLISKLSHKNILSKKMTKGYNLECNERLEIVDRIVQAHPDIKSRKKLDLVDEMNYINTFDKYFVLSDSV